MKLSVFLVLLPSVSAFVPSAHPASSQLASTGQEHGTASSIAPLTAQQESSNEDAGLWSVASMWKGVVGSASDTKAKVDSTAAEVYTELRKTVLVKRHRQELEGQLLSLIRIEGEGMTNKAEQHVRRLAAELEALQENAAAFGNQKTGLAGSWKLMYTTGCKGNKLKSVEEISYVSEHCRLSHTESGGLLVYKRVCPPSKPKSAASAASVAGEDDTATAASGARTVGVKAGRASATAAGRSKPKQPLRKRTFFGWRR